jgi:hypothetical protein
LEYSSPSAPKESDAEKYGDSKFPFHIFLDGTIFEKNGSMITMTRIDVLKTKNIMAQEFTCHSDKKKYKEPPVI